MDYCFYHPDRGYWEAIDKPSQRTLDGYPKGTVRVSKRPAPHCEWQDGKWVEGEAPKPASANVNAERDRRVVAGSAFDLSGYASRVRVTGDNTTKSNLQGLAFGAQLRLAQGDTSTLTPFRDADDVIHMLAPGQMIELWMRCANYVSACFAAGWALKDATDGIPADYADNEHWPKG